MTALTDDALCVSGVEGLDEILAGGIPRDCMYLLQGDPGSGKTTLALQFLLEGQRRGEPGFYITLSESQAELEQVARSHGWSLEGIPLLELSSIDPFLRPEAQTSVFHAGELQLGKVTQMIVAGIQEHRPARIVFDSLSEFRLLAETPLRYRRQLLMLKQEFARSPSTVLLLDDKMDGSESGRDPHVLSLSHGVIEMEQLSPDYGRSRRRLRVAKMRGVKFREGFHDYAIETGGLRIFPRLIEGEHHAEFRRDPVSSGIHELDELLGGGLDRGTTTLVLGQAGTGKSTLAMQYATHIASRGERSMLFAFDETREIVLDRADHLGMKFRANADRGLITLQQVDPAEISPGEFSYRIVKGVRNGCRLVVIDTLNGYLNAMPGERYLNNQLHQLATYLNQKGVLTIFLLTQHASASPSDALVDLSYLADAVVNTCFFEAHGEVRKALSIIKKRSGRHETTTRELMLDAGHGIHVGPPLQDFRGLMNSMPTYVGDTTLMLDHR